MKAESGVCVCVTAPASAPSSLAVPEPVGICSPAGKTGVFGAHLGLTLFSYFFLETLGNPDCEFRALAWVSLCPEPCSCPSFSLFPFFPLPSYTSLLPFHTDPRTDEQLTNIYPTNILSKRASLGTAGRVCSDSRVCKSSAAASRGRAGAVWGRTHTGAPCGGTKCFEVHFFLSALRADFKPEGL